MREVIEKIVCDYCGKQWEEKEIDASGADFLDFCSVECANKHCFENNKEPIPYLDHIHRRVEFYKYKDDIYYEMSETNKEYSKILLVYNIDGPVCTESDSVNNLLVIMENKYGTADIMKFWQYENSNSFRENVYCSGIKITGDLLLKLINGKSDINFLKCILNM